MFGLVTPNLSRLTEEQRKEYQSYYCGLCHSIKDQHNNIARLALTFDMTFLAMVLSSLDETKNTIGECRCVFQPQTKLKTTQNKYTEYAADITIIMAYHKLVDNIYDDNSTLAKIGQRVMKNKYSELSNKYQNIVNLTENSMKKIRKAEKSNTIESGEACSRIFGELLGVIFAENTSLFKDLLYKFGCELGRFIYYMDAAIDYDKDLLSGNFNPFKHTEFAQRLKDNDFLTSKQYYPDAKKHISVFDKKIIYSDFANYLRNQLVNLGGFVANAYEMLPLEKNLPILDNIIYEGIWATFNLKYKNPKDTIK